jgi:hypothetical protein
MTPKSNHDIDIMIWCDWLEDQGHPHADEIRQSVEEGLSNTILNCGAYSTITDIREIRVDEHTYGRGYPKVGTPHHSKVGAGTSYRNQPGNNYFLFAELNKVGGSHHRRNTIPEDQDDTTE